MKSSFEIAVFEGDGIGPEIMKPTLELLDRIAGRHGLTLRFNAVPAGAAHYAKTGEALPPASLQAARSADAILLGAMGLPDVRYKDGTEVSPQIDLRKELDLYAGVRPVTLAEGQNSPIAGAKGRRVDFVLIRESTEGLFWSLGKGEISEDEARETLVITRKTSEKLFRFAFNLAAQRRADGRGRGHVTCVDKANVFRAFAFFRSIFNEEAGRRADIEADHAYVDAMALRMVQAPWDLDVLVTENMFGDILSDLGAGLMGGLGLAPSADIGDRHAVFQPCHGSAPDIAGKGVANPFAMILSAAMMLEWLGHQNETAAAVEAGSALRRSVDEALSRSLALTRDLGGDASTDEAGAAVVTMLEDMAA